MKLLKSVNREDALVGWAILWWLGVPVSLLLVLFLLRGCT